MLEAQIAVSIRKDNSLELALDDLLLEMKEIGRSIRNVKEKISKKAVEYANKAKEYSDYLKPIAVDYAKIWNHLKESKPVQQYLGSSYEPPRAKNGENGESTREMVSTETIDKALWNMKYLGEFFRSIPPFASGIDSKEWEKFKLMLLMSIYRPWLMAKYATC